MIIIFNKILEEAIMLKLYGACVQTKNISEMVKYYSKLFGKEPTVDGGVDHRFLDEQFIIYKLSDNETPTTQNMSMIYQVACAKSYYEELKDKNLPLLDPPTNKPWGVCSFILKDPDGNTISFFNNL
jgi:uncharacterized glyoxalase superfamily protein PhnB